MRPLKILLHFLWKKNNDEKYSCSSIKIQEAFEDQYMNITLMKRVSKHTSLLLHMKYNV